MKSREETGDDKRAIKGVMTVVWERNRGRIEDRGSVEEIQRLNEGINEEKKGWE